MPARSSTFLIAPIGPTPMISGSIPAVAAVMIRARGFRPSSAAFESDMTSTAAAPSLSGHELPAVTLPSRAEGGLELRELLERGAGARAVVLGHLGAVGQGDRHDLAVEEAVLL